MDAELQRQIAAGEIDAVADAFVARLSETPVDAAFLGEAGRALAQAGHEEQADFLLRMADDHLKQAQAWRERLQLLRRAGHLLYPEPIPLHDEIVRSLFAAHSGGAATGGAATGGELAKRLGEKLGLHRAPDDIPKTWDKADRVEELMALAPGTVVAMEGKGAGRVAEVNLQLDSFRVDLGPLGALERRLRGGEEDAAAAPAASRAAAQARRPGRPVGVEARRPGRARARRAGELRRAAHRQRAAAGARRRRRRGGVDELLEPRQEEPATGVAAGGAPALPLGGERRRRRGRRARALRDGAMARTPRPAARATARATRRWCKRW